MVNFPREYCIHEPWLIVALCAANLGIVMAYLAIPATGVWLVRRTEVPFPGIWGLFCGFIVGCGLTHAAAILVFFWPAWMLELFLLAATSIVSTCTAHLLWRARHPILQAIRSYRQLTAHVRELEAQLGNLG